MISCAFSRPLVFLVRHSGSTSKQHLEKHLECPQRSTRSGLPSLLEMTRGPCGYKSMVHNPPSRFRLPQSRKAFHASCRSENTAEPPAWICTHAHSTSATSCKASTPDFWGTCPYACTPSALTTFSTTCAARQECSANHQSSAHLHFHTAPPPPDIPKPQKGKETEPKCLTKSKSKAHSCSMTSALIRCAFIQGAVKA